MKSITKRMCLILTILLVVLQFSPLSVNIGGYQVTGSIAAFAADTPYSWNNTIPQKSPAPGTGNGKLVLFDNSHGETSGNADWVIDGGFSDFADALVQAGYTVREYRGVDKNGDGVIRYYDDRQAANVALNEAVITYDGIKDAAVFVMAEPNRPFTTAEYAALKQFVDSGKGIYFIADHYNADRNLNTWDSTEVFNGYNRSTAAQYNMGGAYGDLRNPCDATKGWLAENFGLRFRFNALDYKAGVSGIKPPSQVEGLTQGVQPVLMAAGATLAIVDPTKAKGLIYFSATDKPVKWGSAVDSGIYYGGEAEGPYVAISKPSAGKAAFIGDSSPIEDITPKYKREGNGTNKSTHDGWKNAGTASVLSINIVNWLATPESYVGFGSTAHPAGIATPNPMAPVEKTTPQAEPWSTPTYDPWNTDTFANGSYGAPYGTSGGGGGTGTPTFALAPAYVYQNQPFAISVGGTATNPEFGAYNGSGTQVGQLYINGTWTSSGYNVISGTTPLAATARVTSADSSLTMKVRTSSTVASTKTVTNMTTGYGFLEGTVNGAQGEIVAATQGGVIVGTAQVSSTKTVKIACKAGTGTTLALYGTNGVKKSDISGTYTVTSGQTTAIVSNVAVTGVTVDKTTMSLAVGATGTITATVNPSNATNKSVTWSSSNTSVATVSGGTVTAVGQGTATVTVRTVDGGFTANCTVTVTTTAAPSLALYPAYTYNNQAFAIAISGNVTNPQFGAYNSSGTQVGQVNNNGTWTTSGYNTVSGSAPLAATVRVVSTSSSLSLRIRTSTGTTLDTKTVTNLTTGYGYMQGTVTGTQGDIVAAIQNGTILGTARIGTSGSVSLTVKSGTGITLAVYGINGVKKSDLAGTYTVNNGATTTIQ